MILKSILTQSQIVSGGSHACCCYAVVFYFLRELDMFSIARLVFGLLNEAIRVNPGKCKCELNARLLLI